MPENKEAKTATDEPLPGFAVDAETLVYLQKLSAPLEAKLPSLQQEDIDRIVEGVSLQMELVLKHLQPAQKEDSKKWQKLIKSLAEKVSLALVTKGIAVLIGFLGIYIEHHMETAGDRQVSDRERELDEARFRIYRLLSKEDRDDLEVDAAKNIVDHHVMEQLKNAIQRAPMYQQVLEWKATEGKAPISDSERESDSEFYAISFRNAVYFELGKTVRELVMRTK